MTFLIAMGEILTSKAKIVNAPPKDDKKKNNDKEVNDMSDDDSDDGSDDDSDDEDYDSDDDGSDDGTINENLDVPPELSEI